MARLNLDVKDNVRGLWGVLSYGTGCLGALLLSATIFFSWSYFSDTNTQPPIQFESCRAVWAESDMTLEAKERLLKARECKPCWFEEKGCVGSDYDLLDLAIWWISTLLFIWCTYWIRSSKMKSPAAS